jgi:hypothetical protein
MTSLGGILNKGVTHKPTDSISTDNAVQNVTTPQLIDDGKAAPVECVIPKRRGEQKWLVIQKKSTFYMYIRVSMGHCKRTNKVERTKIGSLSTLSQTTFMLFVFVDINKRHIIVE